MPGVCVRFVSTAKNLGFRIDSQLNFSDQVNQLKVSSFHKLRNIAKMKPFLTKSQIIQLVCTLILQPLDYCNALYYGCSSHIMHQLQYIQNRACAIVMGLKKRDPKKEHMKNLHWLRVPERIEFKILLTVFKCINGIAPAYLSDLICYNSVSGSRAPSLHVTIPQSMIGARAFVCYSGRLWNELPVEIKCETDILKFKSLLKTYLFKKSYNLC